jgi:hypothetical protein
MKMRKEIETFDEYMADESRVSLAQREQILSEAALIGRVIKASEKEDFPEGN